MRIRKRPLVGLLALLIIAAGISCAVIVEKLKNKPRTNNGFGAYSEDATTSYKNASPSSTTTSTESGQDAPLPPPLSPGASLASASTSSSSAAAGTSSSPSFGSGGLYEITQNQNYKINLTLRLDSSIESYTDLETWITDQMDPLFAQQLSTLGTFTARMTALASQESSQVPSSEYAAFAELFRNDAKNTGGFEDAYAAIKKTIAAKIAALESMKASLAKTSYVSKQEFEDEANSLSTYDTDRKAIYADMKSEFGLYAAYISQRDAKYDAAATSATGVFGNSPDFTAITSDIAQLRIPTLKALDCVLFLASGDIPPSGVICNF
jgi:hypothetical protein